MDIWDLIAQGGEHGDVLVSGLHQFFDEHNPEDISFNPMIYIYESCPDHFVKKKLLPVVLGYPRFAHKCHHEGEPPHDFSSWLMSHTGVIGLKFLQELEWDFSSVDANGCGLLHKIHQFSLNDETLTLFINRYPALLEQRNVLSHTPLETHLQLGNIEELNRLIILGASLPKFDDVRMALLPDISREWLSQIVAHGVDFAFGSLKNCGQSSKQALN